MKKNPFIQSTIILLIGGLVTKILGMFIRMIETRLLGTEGIGLFMLISPTFTLLIALAQMGLPVAISTLVARDTYSNQKLLLSILPICIFTNFIIFLLLFFFGHSFCTYLLKENRVYYAILSIGFVLPFISISSILRGYFFGKQKMFPHVFSNFIEDLLRLFLLWKGIPYFLSKGISSAVAFLVFSNLFSECASIFVMYLFLPKEIKISKSDFLPDKKLLKEILSISIPTTFSRLIGSIGYFLEPIILTNVLRSVGYSNEFIIKEYGILEGYVMPIVMLPSFFTMAISQALIPVISKAYGKHQYHYAKNKIKQAIGFSLLVGIPASLLFFFDPKLPIQLIYRTTKGTTYLKWISPFFLIYYIQSPLTSALQATGKAKIAMRGTFIGMILRTVLLTVCSCFSIGMWGLIIAMLTNIFFVTIHQSISLKHLLKET